MDFTIVMPIPGRLWDTQSVVCENSLLHSHPKTIIHSKLPLVKRHKNLFRGCMQLIWERGKMNTSPRRLLRVRLSVFIFVFLGFFSHSSYFPSNYFYPEGSSCDVWKQCDGGNKFILATYPEQWCHNRSKTGSYQEDHLLCAITLPGTFGTLKQRFPHREPLRLEQGSSDSTCDSTIKTCNALHMWVFNSMCGCGGDSGLVYAHDQEAPLLFCSDIR